MAIPFILPVEEDQQEFSTQQLQTILALYSALDRYLRTRTNISPTYVNNHRVAIGQSGLVLLDQDMAGLPLPDLVSSAMRQLQPPSPRVTVSAPTSPTRDATFQFPECSSSSNAVAVAAAAAASYTNTARTSNYENENEEEEGASVPTPTPRPRPRRNRPINVRVPFKKAVPICNGEQLSNNCSEYPGHVLRNEQFLIDIGTTLRKIAQDLQASKSKNNETENLRLSLMASGFSSNTNTNSEDIVGSLIPASYRETTLWVTVVLYLGWTLISRLR